MTIELKAPEVEKDPEEQLYALLLGEFPKKKDEASRDLTPEPDRNAPKKGGKAAPAKGAGAKANPKDEKE
eukprot:CAMPEP_0114590110 /NCGR_PEP_ID=MMETSP0125-20121206/12420_1 /TAXON_ID=485358 ORGANISM="Aristerostoma sp., Strain ATCC 50986" /NCGR_SAMPLE_ID=MMETSP0125 /ASSEMBLY_ACC=CAM_ASM_000245 /LENGTH=69 /DNA_ID=CAMNT_0001787393 /DNA_START=671 /DNA_END=880 /DNA_ORIENTATION=+